MAKNENTIFWIVGIAIILFLILPKINLSEENSEGFGVNVHFYDADKNEVFPEKSGFSIITPPGRDFEYISFSVTARAENLSYSNIRIRGATPTAFFTALPTTTQSLAVGESKTLWSSELIAANQFESMTQPVRFWVNISAVNGFTQQTEYVQGQVDLRIEPSQFGTGANGQLIFTSATKSYGNLVQGTDYQVSGNILYLKIDTIYEFTSFTLGPGMELRPWNPSTRGTTLFIKAKNQAIIEGIVRSRFDYAYNSVRGQSVQTTWITSAGETISTPGVGSGGRGGDGGVPCPGTWCYWPDADTGTSQLGGSQSNGYGGGGAGGGAEIYSGAYNGFTFGGGGGIGGISPSGGLGGQCRASGTERRDGGFGSQSGGGGGACRYQNGASASVANGGTGGGSFSAGGSSGCASSSSPCDVQSADGDIASGGGGAGGLPGYSGIHFYLYSADISFTGTIDTSGTSGTGGGAGGNAALGSSESYVRSGGGGGGGAGGGGGSGNINFKYNSLSDTGTKIMNRGTGGSGGGGGAGVYSTSSGGSVYPPRYYNHCGGSGGCTYGNSGGSGGTGSQGTFNSGGGFCIACWFDNIFR